MKHVLSMLIAHVQQNRWIPVIPQGRRVLSKKTLQPILMEKPWSQPVEHMMGTYSISMHLYEFIAYLCKFDNIYIYCVRNCRYRSGDIIFRPTHILHHAVMAISGWSLGLDGNWLEHVPTQLWQPRFFRRHRQPRGLGPETTSCLAGT